MDDAFVFSLLADAVLILHFSFAAFVVLGFGLNLAGLAVGWNWVRNRWFRIAHLLAIGVVVLQAWLGVICPLTILEMWLRERAGDAVYAGTFISHWLESILYYQAPMWVFTVCYTVFGAVVVLSWFWVRPQRRSN